MKFRAVVVLTGVAVFAAAPVQGAVKPKGKTIEVGDNYYAPKAVTVDPSYPDAHFFRGYVLLKDMKQPKQAIPEFQQYLVAAPDSPLADQVRSLLAEAVKAGK